MMYNARYDAIYEKGIITLTCLKNTSKISNSSCIGKSRQYICKFTK